MKHINFYCSSLTALVLGFLTIGGASAAQPSLPVKVTNTASQPVPIVNSENPDLSPYQEEREVTFSNLSVVTPFAVPTNTRVVVEYVAVHCRAENEADNLPLVLLQVRKSTATPIQFLEVSAVALEKRGVSASSAGGAIWTGAAKIHLYHEGGNDGTPMFLHIQHTAIGSTVVCNGTVSGHTVNNP